MQTQAEKTFGGCTRAYLDGFGGLIKCTVIGVQNECSGRYATGGKEDLTVEIDETRGGYRKGEIVYGSAAQFPPRSMVSTRRGQYYVNVNYRWVKGI